VLTLARPRPVALATSLAVIAVPDVSASSTALFVPADRVRPPFTAWGPRSERDGAGVRRVRVADEPDAGPDRRARGLAALRERGARPACDAPPRDPPSAANAFRSRSASFVSSSRRACMSRRISSITSCLHEFECITARHSTAADVAACTRPSATDRIGTLDNSVLGVYRCNCFCRYDARLRPSAYDLATAAPEHEARYSATYRSLGTEVSRAALASPNDDARRDDEAPSLCQSASPFGEAAATRKPPVLLCIGSSTADRV
jgi:hypothetical protein